MPRKLELTWQPGASGREGRWRKKYKGRVFYFPGGRGKTDREAEAAAIAEWATLKANIDGETPKQFQREYETAITVWEQVLFWCRKHRDDAMAETAVAKLAVLKNEFANRKPRPLVKSDLFDGQFELGIRSPAYAKMIEEIAQIAFGPPEPPTAKSIVVDTGMLVDELEIEKHVWADRFAVEQKLNDAPDNSIKVQIEDFLNHKKSAAIVGNITIGRIENLRAHLHRFRDWIGPATPVTEITSSVLIRYHDSLIKDVQANATSSTTAHERIGAVKSLVRRLWQHERIPNLPRVLASESKELDIAKSTSPIVIFSSAEIAKVLTKSSARSQLYFLLMLNCGMTQKDISDLTFTEIDLSAGRITRKRSKTRQHKSVPTVNYLLWPETLSLLRRNCKLKKEGRVFLNENGSPLWHDEQKSDGKYSKSDNIRSAFERIQKKVGITKSLKSFRKTSATLLANSKDFRGLEDLFLGHAPRRISEKHYVQSSVNVLDDALEWLRGEYHLAKLAVFNFSQHVKPGRHQANLLN